MRVYLSNCHGRKSERNRMRDHLALTVLGARGVQKERAERFPTAPTHREIRGVISD